VKTGIFDYDYETYAGLKAVNRSTLALLALTPAHAKAQEETSLKKQTKALKMGIALHSLVLENKTDDRVKLTELEKTTVEGMATASRDSKAFQGALSGAVVETSLVWQDVETGVYCKARPDALRFDQKTIYDLKSCSSITKFRYDVWSYRYHLQAAFYLMGCKALGLDVQHFKFLAVENKPIWGTKVFALSPAAISLGTYQLQNLLRLYAACQEAGHWPGYGEDEEVIEVPATEMTTITEMENDLWT
jgi:hypothetical protein